MEDDRVRTEEMVVRPVGRVRSSFVDLHTGPRKHDFSAQEAVIEVLPAFARGLLNIDRMLGTTLVVVYRFHRTAAEPCRLTVRPHGDPTRTPRGVFATNCNHRPNSIALCCVTLVAVESPTAIRVRGLDAVDGSPVLDIKPYPCCAYHDPSSSSSSSSPSSSSSLSSS